MDTVGFSSGMRQSCAVRLKMPDSEDLFTRHDIRWIRDVMPPN